MQKFSFVFFLIICFYNVNAQQNNNIVIGKVKTIESKVLNEKRDILIYTPDGISEKKRYPVVYLLDGYSHFHSVVGLLHRLSLTNLCPEMIVVGITNTNRTRDLTPTKANPDLSLIHI